MDFRWEIVSFLSLKWKEIDKIKNERNSDLMTPRLPLKKIYIICNLLPLSVIPSTISFNGENLLFFSALLDLGDHCEAWVRVQIQIILSNVK